MNTPQDTAACRQHLEAILASKTFSSSRQLSDFLRFITERSLDNATHLGQEEIAEHVLGKGRSFDATYDSAIRKFASLTRQRLARYYAEEGTADALELTLPLRSYLPVFRPREPAVIPKPAPSRRSMLAIAVALTVILLLAALWAWRRPSPDVHTAIYTITTAQGDLAYAGSDAPRDGVLLGGPLEDGKALTAHLTFQPEHELQQAGILLWRDADNYVRLGRSFAGRNYIEFTAEQKGGSSTAAENLIYDPEGQSGRPVWLSIRRNGTEYRGFISNDGVDWRQLGIPLTLPELTAPRIGIYTYHGRRESPPTPAEFRYVSREFFLADADNESLSAIVQSKCGHELHVASQPPFLQLRLLETAPACSALLPVARLRDQRWMIEARLDSIVVPGAMAGIYLLGSKGRMRLIRYGTDQPSISLMHDNKSVQSMPDFNGAPPLTLRLERQGDWLIGSSSRDGRTYRPFTTRVAAADIGPELEAGLLLAISGKGKPQIAPSMGLYYWREAAEELRPYR